MKSFCTPRSIEQTPTKLPVDIDSNNEIKHSVACYRCIFINHNIVHCFLITSKFIQQEALDYVTVPLSYDKKSFRNTDDKKGFGKCFLISNNIENKILTNTLK